MARRRHRDHPFTPDGVFRNERSPATYLNEERYADVAVPADASASAEPNWRKVSERPSWDWHDHRIHWMSTIDASKIRNVPKAGAPRLRLGGARPPRRTAAHHPGSLDYQPPPATRFSWKCAVPLILLALAGSAAWIWRLKRKRKPRPG